MKHLFAILGSVVSISALSQITVLSYDYRLPIAPDTAHLKVVAAGNSTITPGNNMSWDYSQLFTSTDIDYAMEPNSNPDFPSSRGRIEVPVNLGGGLILDQMYNYYGMGLQGYYQNGFGIEGKTVSLAAMSGDMNDSLRTLDTVQPFQIQLLKFPLQLGSTWSSQASVWVPMEITVESLAWYDQLISIKQDIATTDSVVGWGTIVLPSGVTTEALLVHHHTLRIDSVFEAGQPMNPVFAANFGFNQNDTSRIDRWAFYGKGMNSSLYEYTVINGQRSSPVYNRSQNISIGETRANPLVVYPNPAANYVQVMSDNAQDIRLMNLAGVIVKHASASDWNNGMIRIDVSDLPAGIYLIRTDDHAVKVTVR